MSLYPTASNATTGNIPKAPRRPLTKYNIFYILERQYILQQHQKISSSLIRCDFNFDPDFNERPPKYRQVVLPLNWFVVGVNREKRRDHINHGVIDFKELSQMIANNWSSADPEVKEYCAKLARQEMAKFNADKAGFIAIYGVEAFDAQRKGRLKVCKPTKIETNTSSCGK